LCYQENRVSPKDRTWLGKSFVRIVQVLELKSFGFYFFAILLSKPLASTTSRTLGEDPGSDRFVEMLG
jgi:hypothetical protein